MSKNYSPFSKTGTCVSLSSAGGTTPTIPVIAVKAPHVSEVETQPVPLSRIRELGRKIMKTHDETFRKLAQ